MSWIAASDYLAIEQAVQDRLGEVERFNTEQAFRPETPRDECPARVRMTLFEVAHEISLTRIFLRDEQGAREAEAPLRTFHTTERARQR